MEKSSSAIFKNDDGGVPNKWAPSKIVDPTDYAYSA